MNKYILFMIFICFQTANAAITLTLNTAPPNQIHLSWSQTSPNDWYQIQKSFNGLDFFTIGNTAPSNLVFTDNHLYYQIKYWYQIISHRSDGSISDVSNVAAITSLTSLPNPFPAWFDSFDSMNITSAWKSVGGHWLQKGGILQQIDHQGLGDIKKMIVNNTNYSNDQTITAKVRVTGWQGTPHVGVGIFTDLQKGLGYELVFHKPNEVQFLNHGVTWGNAFAFVWKIRTWYWFKLTSQQGILKGKVWADGSNEPSEWLFEQTGWNNRTGGNPALDGGTAYKK